MQIHSGKILFFCFAIGVWADTNPLVEFLFNQNAGTSAINTGSVGGAGTLTAGTPAWSSNTPVHGGVSSVDFGSTAGNFAVDLPAPAALQNLKSFTIAGWINRRILTTNESGDRIVTWLLNGGQGVELAYRSDGSLRIGINEANDVGGAGSSGGKILVDANASYNNWRFFAVTYNSLLSTEQVKFYFGSPSTNAALDRSVTYGQGQVGASIATNLTIGHLNTSALRAANPTALFKGLIDQIRLYGNAADGSGALTESQIVVLQNALPIDGRSGVLYEAWDNIGNGSNVSDLTTNLAFQGNPSYSAVYQTFDGPQNRGDNFGARMSGWIKAPATGGYVFYISSDDKSELRLSTDVNPSNKRLIASVSGFTNHAQFSKYANQASNDPSNLNDVVNLVAGQYYYIEALMKESGGSDNLSVGWKLPADAPSAAPQIIPEGVLFLSPDESSPLFPSTVRLYEQGTQNNKATLGWQKETGNDHFYIETEGEKKIRIHNDVVSIPKKLFFGGLFSDQYDLGFRWDRSAQDDIGSLYLEAGNGQAALRVTGPSETDPSVEFNKEFTAVGPDVTLPASETRPTDELWSGGAVLNYFDGLGFNRTHQTPYGYIDELAFFNGNALTLNQTTVENNQTMFDQKTTLQGGSLEFATKSLDEPFESSLKLDLEGMTYSKVIGTNTRSVTIDATGITTTGKVRADSYVSTPSWKIVPDYVFEKGYRPKSLEELEQFVKKEKHLPDFPAAKQIGEKGMDLTDMNLKLLKSVEELTLNVIALNKELQAEKKRNDEIAKQIEQAKAEGK